MLGAAWSDLADRRVYNRLLLPGAVAGILFQGVDFIIPAAFVLVPAFFFFKAGVMGAGDGKLMAFIAGYLGLEQGFCAIAAGFLLGAVWSLYKLVSRNCLRTRLSYFFAYFRQFIHTGRLTVYDAGGRGNTIPLACCLVLGTWAVLAWSQIRQ